MQVNLSQVAVMAAFNGHAHGHRFIDDGGTAEYAEVHAATVDSHRVQKDIFPAGAVPGEPDENGKRKITYIGCGKDNAYRKTVGAISRWRRQFRSPEWTLDIGDKNARLLPTARFTSFQDWKAEIQTQLTLHKDELRAKYAELKQLARNARGPAYDEKDYPQLEEFLASFSVEAETWPITTMPRVIQGLTEVQVNDMRQRMEAQEQARITLIETQNWDRLLNIVRELQTKLDTLGQEDGPTVVFKTTLDALRKACLETPVNNLSGDLALNGIAAQIKEKIEGVDNKLLKGNPDWVTHLQGSCQKILNTFGGMGSFTRKFE